MRLTNHSFFCTPNTPLESWGANRPRAVLQGPAESRGYQRLQRAPRVPKNLGVHRVSGFRRSQRVSSGCVCCVWGGGGVQMVKRRELQRDQGSAEGLGDGDSRGSWGTPEAR